MTEARTRPRNIKYGIHFGRRVASEPPKLAVMGSIPIRSANADDQIGMLLGKVFPHPLLVLRIGGLTVRDTARCGCLPVTEDIGGFESLTYRFMHLSPNGYGTSLRTKTNCRFESYQVYEWL